MNPMFFGHNQSLGSGYVSFSDDFNRANSNDIGSNWEELGVDVDIISNALRFSSSSGGTAIWKAPVNGATQWGKFTVSYSNSGNYFGFYFRVDAPAHGSTGYSLSFYDVDDICAWFRANIAMESTQIGSGASLSIASGNTFGFTIQGLGTNTVIRIWRNPTGLPISAANWNGDTTPDVTFTQNPPSPAKDTGLYIGLWGTPNSSGNNLSCDNWFGGTCPD